MKLKQEIENEPEVIVKIAGHTDGNVLIFECRPWHYCGEIKDGLGVRFSGETFEDRHGAPVSGKRITRQAPWVISFKDLEKVYQTAKEEYDKIKKRS